MILLNKHFDSLLAIHKLPMSIVLTRMVRDKVGYLCIATECGKPLKMFNAPAVNNRMTVEERDYLTDAVLTPWITTHHKALGRYYEFVIDDLVGCCFDDLKTELAAFDITVNSTYSWDGEALTARFAEDTRWQNFRFHYDKKEFLVGIEGGRTSFVSIPVCLAFAAWLKSKEGVALRKLLDTYSADRIKLMEEEALLQQLMTGKCIA
jgi:hypothetical protein